MTRVTSWKSLLVAAVAVVLALSVARIGALTHGYGAPMSVYSSLPLPVPKIPVIPSEDSASVSGRGRGGANLTANVALGVCVGGEWYRFPSSFHLPSPAYRLKFIQSPFVGALPVPFDTARGGTRFAPAGLNDQNAPDPLQYAPDPWGVHGDCYFVVDAHLVNVEPAIDPSRVMRRGVSRRSTGNAGSSFGDAGKGGNGKDGGEDDDDDDRDPWKKAGGAKGAVEGSRRTMWEVVREAEFLDQANSPAFSRAFYIPGWSYGRNKYGTYRVLRRIDPKP